MIFSVVLTEGRLHSDGGGLLRLLTEAVDVDSLDAEHVGLTWDQAVDHEPDRHRYFKLSSRRRSKQTRKQTAKITPPLHPCVPPRPPPRSLPGVSEGFVVAGEPLLRSHHAGVDVISHDVFGVFGRLPLDKDGGLGVPGGNDLTRSRGNAWRIRRAGVRYSSLITK